MDGRMPLALRVEAPREALVEKAVCILRRELAGRGIGTADAPDAASARLVLSIDPAAGPEGYSIEHRRLRYYLYPFVEKENPEYIFVYKTKDFTRQDYKVFKRMDAETYILRKID